MVLGHRKLCAFYGAARRNRFSRFSARPFAQRLPGFDLPVGVNGLCERECLADAELEPAGVYPIGTLPQDVNVVLACGIQPAQHGGEHQLETITEVPQPGLGQREQARIEQCEWR
jgi:hypothetical protein